jgi:endonuclease YncB( thermonuclease family)
MKDHAPVDRSSFPSLQIAAEEAACAEGIGIWQGPAEPPWEWRLRQQTRVAAVASGSAPEGRNIKCNINS